MKFSAINCKILFVPNDGSSVWQPEVLHLDHFILNGSSHYELLVSSDILYPQVGTTGALSIELGAATLVKQVAVYSETSTEDGQRVFHLEELRLEL